MKNRKSFHEAGRQAGLSLIELIVVVAVMAVVVGLAVESYIVTHRFCAVGTNSTRALQTVRYVAAKLTKDVQFHAGTGFTGKAGETSWLDSLSFDRWESEAGVLKRKTVTYDLDSLKAVDPDIDGVDFQYMGASPADGMTETWPGPGAPVLVRLRLRLLNYRRADVYETSVHIPKEVTGP